MGRTLLTNVVVSLLVCEIIRPDLLFREGEKKVVELFSLLDTFSHLVSGVSTHVCVASRSSPYKGVSGTVPVREEWGLLCLLTHSGTPMGRGVEGGWGADKKKKKKGQKRESKP